MIAPGSKGWINKYFELQEKDTFSLDVNVPTGLTDKEFAHFTFLRVGIAFGVPVELIFAKTINQEAWTTAEKLKVLLFESLLLMYKMHRKEEEFNVDRFKQSLLDFYRGHNSPLISNVFKLFLGETPDERLENALSSRLSMKYKVTDTKYWVNYLSNAFVYLDVILFREFLKGKKEVLSKYSELADNALVAITMAAFSDHKFNEQEKAMFKIFLDSANLRDKQRSHAKERFKKGASLSDFTAIVQTDLLFRRFLIDISALTVFVNQNKMPEDYPFFISLCEFLKVPQDEVNTAMAMIENFVLVNSEKVDLLSGASSYEKLYGNLSKRWIKILSRNKVKLAKEIRESKELVFLITKSTKEELTKEEKEMVRTQFLDVVKSVPALAIFLLPGGVILLPIVLKIIPDLVPSAFRDNKLDAKLDTKLKSKNEGKLEK